VGSAVHEDVIIAPALVVGRLEAQPPGPTEVAAGTMRADWQAFLEGAGARIGEGGVASFGEPRRELQRAASAEVLADLSHLGVISVQGEDAATFLQGQLTCDLRLVTEERSSLGAYLSPKGRALAVLRIHKRPEAYYLTLPGPLTQPIVRRLRMFVLRAKVLIEDASEAWVRLGLSGPHIERSLASRLGVFPHEVGAAVLQDGISILRIPGPHARVVLTAQDSDTMTRLWTGLRETATPVGRGAWELLDILAGIPEVYPETAEAFVPQMLNLQALGAISFTKGCYTGQEIVARTQYLGTLKRRMYRAQVEADTPPRPGQHLYVAGPQGQQSVGEVVASQAAPDGGCELLAVLLAESVEAGEVRLDSPQGPRLEFRKLPYTVEPETAAVR
jgi:folate-binding protein YgfZ